MACKDKCLRQRFSVRGDFCSPFLGTCGNMWWYFCMGGGGYWYVVSKEMLTNIIQGSGKSLPKKKYSVPPVNSNSVQVMKLWSEVLLKAIQLNSFHHDTLLETCTWKIKEFYLKRLLIYVKKIYTVCLCLWEPQLISTSASVAGIVVPEITVVFSTGKAEVSTHTRVWRPTRAKIS